MKPSNSMFHLIVACTDCDRRQEPFNILNGVIINFSTVFFFRNTECHGASWWVGAVHHCGKILVPGAAWHWSGWHCTRRAMHSWYVDFIQAIDTERQRLSRHLLGGRFLHHGCRAWVGDPEIEGNSILRSQIRIRIHPNHCVVSNLLVDMIGRRRIYVRMTFGRKLVSAN